MTSDILDEVLLEQIDAKKIHYFQRALFPVISIAIIIAVLIFSYNWYYNDIKKKNAELGDSLISKIYPDLQTKDTLENINSKSNYNNEKILGLKEIEQANALILTNNSQQALDLLNQITTKPYDKIITSYAKILWLSIILDKEHLTDKENDNLEKFLSDFSDDQKPFYGIATLYKALWHLKNNQYNLAVNVLQNIIQSPLISRAIKDQATAIISNVGQRKGIL